MIANVLLCLRSWRPCLGASPAEKLPPFPCRETHPPSSSPPTFRPIFCCCTKEGSRPSQQHALLAQGDCFCSGLCGCIAMTGNAHADCNWGYGETVARLTQDQKVGNSNLSAFYILVRKGPGLGSRLRCATTPRNGAVAHPNNQTNAETRDRTGTGSADFSKLIRKFQAGGV